MNRAHLALFAGEGPASVAARAVDWSKTAIGAPETWPMSLRTTLGILMNSRHPMFLWWGAELLQFYNDAYLPSFGRGKHPAAMGQRGAECWQEIWSIIYPQIEDAMIRGKASWNENQLVPIYRNDRIEEVYWTYGYSPVFDETSGVGGVLVVCTETTDGVLAMRRLDFIRKLAIALNDAQDFADVTRITAARLAEGTLDIPFSVVGIDSSDPVVVGLDSSTIPECLAPLAEVSFARRKLVSGIACQPWPELVTDAVVHRYQGTWSGTFTFGLSPRLSYEDSYRNFLQQVVEQIVTAHGRISVEVERRRLLLQAPVATAILIGPDHVFEIANPRYVAMVGRDVLGKRYADVFPELRESELSRVIHDVYHRGEPFNAHEMRVPLARTEGTKPEDKFFNFTLEPIRDVRGKVYGMMAVAVDITAHVTARILLERADEERSQLLVAAQAASRAKDEFLAMLGHELRNPLAPIMTALDIMKMKNVTGVEHEREIIERQASHLVHLVDDLLDVSRVVEGKIELKKRRIDLADVIDTAIEMASPLLEARRHELRVEVPSRELIVDADPMRLAQVVANLLTNAARYTDPGGQIRIQTRAVDHDVVLGVEDNGIGIAEDQIPYLFERFFQGSLSLDRAQGGLGLGLALVKSLTELHGGSVRVESAGPGRGSAFEIRLPFAAPETSSPEVPMQASGPLEVAETERVLLVDDSEDITDLFSAVLELSGFHVRTAHDGPSALRVAMEYKPTIAVLDLGLPVMNGFEVATRLLEEFGPSAPRLIAMSGYGRQDDVERTRQAGFERHLVKPVDAKALLRAIRG